MTDNFHEYLGGEVPEGIEHAISDFVPNNIAGFEGLVAADHELVVSINTIHGKMVHFDAYQLEHVTPSEAPGTFVMFLKDKMAEHKKIVGAISVAVTGSALLAAYIRQRRKT